MKLQEHLCNICYITGIFIKYPHISNLPGCLDFLLSTSKGNFQDLREENFAAAKILKNLILSRTIVEAAVCTPGVTYM